MSSVSSILLWVRSDCAPESADEPAEASVISWKPKVTPGCDTTVRQSSGARWNPGGTGAVSAAVAGVPAARAAPASINTVGRTITLGAAFAAAFTPVFGAAVGAAVGDVGDAITGDGEAAPCSAPTATAGVGAYATARLTAPSVRGASAARVRNGDEALVVLPTTAARTLTAATPSTRKATTASGRAEPLALLRTAGVGESEWGIGIASQVGNEPVDNHSAPSSVTHRTTAQSRPAPAVH